MNYTYIFRYLVLLLSFVANVHHISEINNNNCIVDRRQTTIDKLYIIILNNSSRRSKNKVLVILVYNSLKIPTNNKNKQSTHHSPTPLQVINISLPMEKVS